MTKQTLLDNNSEAPMREPTYSKRDRGAELTHTILLMSAISKTDAKTVPTIIIVRINRCVTLPQNTWRSTTIYHTTAPRDANAALNGGAKILVINGEIQNILY